MPNIQRSVLIHARIAQIWDVLTTPRLIAEWANTFLPGMYAESAWIKGCDVVWKNPDGSVALRGRLEDARRGRLLKVVFSAEFNEGMTADEMAFSETYTLVEEPDGIRLSIDCGPLREQDYRVLHEPWGRALEAIKRLAEAGGAASMPRSQQSAGHRAA